MPAPDKPELPEDYQHAELHARVIRALHAIPTHFSTNLNLDGIIATDVQTLNSALGAAIEAQAVETLNNMRPVWDPENQYLRFGFQRQAQVFPDVLLKAEDNGQETALGIELKGWYLLSKEKEPNYRFTTTAAACHPADLLVVIPWALSNVLSGSPVTFRPFIIGARYAALYRNYWWREVRKLANPTDDTSISSPTDIQPYPASKSSQIADRPAKDGGGNFGRLARTGLMDDYVQRTLNLQLSGIRAEDWVNFLRRFRQ